MEAKCGLRIIVREQIYADVCVESKVALALVLNRLETTRTKSFLVAFARRVFEHEYEDASVGMKLPARRGLGSC